MQIFIIFKAFAMICYLSNGKKVMFNNIPMQQTVQSFWISPWISIFIYKKKKAAAIFFEILIQGEIQSWGLPITREYC